MKVTDIKVSAGRTFNHPFENFSNLRFDMTLQAVLEDGDDYQNAVRDLQAQAEKLAEDHKRAL